MNRNNLYHMDIKPENIVCRENTCRIIDFGLACHVHPVSHKVTMGKDDMKDADGAVIPATAGFSNGLNYYYWPYEIFMVDVPTVYLYNENRIKWALSLMVPPFLNHYNARKLSIERQLMKRVHSKFFGLTDLGKQKAFYSGIAKKLARLSRAQIADKFDPYSLGISILFLCGLSNVFWRSKVLNLVRALTHPDPTERPNATEAYDSYLYVMRKFFNVRLERRPLDIPIEGRGLSVGTSEQSRQHRRQVAIRGPQSRAVTTGAIRGPPSAAAASKAASSRAASRAAPAAAGHMDSASSNKAVFNEGANMPSVTSTTAVFHAEADEGYERTPEL